MAQHDYTIANQGFPAFRSDLNDALAAVVSNNSGATEPTTMFAHQIWVDTAADPSILKIRNADNDAWITIGSIDQTGDKFNLTCANATLAENLTLNAQGDLRFADADSSNYVGFQAPTTVAADVLWTLPSVDGTSGQVLSTDGSGTLSWTTGGNSIAEGNSNVTVTDAGTGKIEFSVDGVEVADFTTSATIFNETGANQDFRVEGDTNENLFVVDASADHVGIGTNAPAVLAHVQDTTATTDAVTQVLRIDSQSSGTPANGIGVGMQFATETSAGNTEIGATIEAITTDVNAASEDFDLSFKTMAGGGAAAERMRLTSTGEIKFNSGYGSAAVAYGCRAWVNFDGTTNTGGNCDIRASGNVTSITDNGTGDYTVTFTTAMPDGDYSVVATTVNNVNATTTNRSVGVYSANASPGENYMLVGSVRILMQSSNAAEIDQSVVCVAIFR